MAEVPATADLIDAHGDLLASCETQLRQFGARRAFQGTIVTVTCREDNALVKRLLGTPGQGRVLVVDGGGSLRSALMGDLIAASAARNGWAGVVINGAVRDTAQLAHIDLGIKALGSNPRKSAKTGAGAVDVPVAFGGVVFDPGAWLCSDEDGIVVAAEKPGA
ncbi:ribonuclease E activity regulator RraA [Marinactinospora thermotolerans]|uniref:4-hydroxy-4-methyl-2-oxoglutarate aldolase n=1 Tax=Marinactinospora thermotolerans DSM 45154 TaxID=1122192 RepID=A0A1T4N266_9ACTN|nr:ribonuclease E activity regulator RraA [Marinactinospora thermotolerans]SJZ73206.1 regulator of ribonuclease activity A [Marinactinospora thermotolerans DSM 45154]